MAEREPWRGKNTWKQISTNVPPETLKVLSQIVKKDNTSMSQLIREIIDDSHLIKYGDVPRPTWAAEFNESITALREEIADLRAEVCTAKKTNLELASDDLTIMPELTQQIADLKKELLVVRDQTMIKLEEFEETRTDASASGEIKTNGRWPRLIGQLTKVFQFRGARQPASNEDSALLEVG